MTRVSSVSVEQCTNEQLKTLLGLAQGEEGAHSLPAAADRQKLSVLLAELCGDHPVFGDGPLEAVADPEAPLEALQELKELAKERLDTAPSEAHRDAARFLYHAAIAAALGRHGRNISSRPAAARLDLYEDLATVLVGDPLGELFRRAADRLLPGKEKRRR